MLPIFGAPDWVAKVFVFAVALGFVPVLIFSWAYEITPEGIKKESEIDQSQSISSDTGRKLDRVIILVLTIAVVIFAVDKFSVSPEPTSPATTAGDSSSETQQQSIAVLPFVNISSDLEQEYFSDGLSEELLNLLAKIPELRVTSRSSAFSYKGKDFKIADVGRELNVRHVLEGSVRKSGDKVRITAQLIDVASDAHIWSETWDRTLDDVFVIQDEIALAVVNALKIELLDAAPTAATTSGDVFTLFLEARYLVVERSESGFKKAEKLLKEALEIDPNYAPAWSGLANVYARGARMGAWPVHEAARLSREAAHRALAIDPSDGRAHGVLSEIAGIQDRDIETSEEHLRKALLLEPGNSDVLLHATESAMRTGHYEQCLYYADRALVLDPLNFTIYTAKGYCHYFLGENDAAIAALQKKISVNPLMLPSSSLVRVKYQVTPSFLFISTEFLTVSSVKVKPKSTSSY